MDKMKLLGQARRGLRVATDLIGKLPGSDDSVLIKLVKLFAIVDSFDRGFVKVSAVDDYFEGKEVDIKKSAQFVDMFFRTELKNSFKVFRHTIGENANIVVAKDAELGNLYFLEYRWSGRPYQMSEFWYTKGFDFDKALSRMWTLYGNGLHISLKKTEDYEQVATNYEPLNVSEGKMIGSSVALFEKLSKKHKERLARGYPCTYLFLGKQGAGKSTFAIRMAKMSNSRILHIDADGFDAAKASDLSFLIEGLSPDFLILDDLDRVKGATAVLLEALARLKSLHKGVTVVITANSIKAFDVAIRRPGRIDQIIEFADPTVEDRLEILAAYCKQFGVNFANLYKLAEETDGLTAAYLEEVAIQLQYSTTEEVLEVIRLMKKFASDEEPKKEEGKTAPGDPPSGCGVVLKG